MKIIAQKYVPPKIDYTKKLICQHCDAYLEVEASDWRMSNPDECYNGNYYGEFNCPVCNKVHMQFVAREIFTNRKAGRLK